ncbi:MAG: hypothetical protein EXR58_05680 [Chloroflexi bacterium]|nr:hypothetical protein [Chloroflexota bacterium]
MTAILEPPTIQAANRTRSGRFRPPFNVNRLLGYAIPLLVPGCLVLALAHHLAFVIGITNLDYFPQVDWALRLEPTRWVDWVNWQYPVGFPWLVRLGIGAGIDAARLGQTFSVLGGVFALFGVYGLARAVGGSRTFAVVCQVFAALNARFLFFSGFEGNDMLAAGLQDCSLGLVALALARGEKDGSPKAIWIGLAAVSAGLGYLIRYTSLVTAGAAGLVLVAIALRSSRRDAWRAVVLYGVLFVLASAPQWVPTLVVTGSPLSNDQGPNVWFAVFEKTDFIKDWADAPPGITVAGVFARAPGQFVEHWWTNFQSFWFSPDGALLGVPLGMAGPVGLVYLLASRGPGWPIKLLLAIFVSLHVSALSMMRLDPRFLNLLIAPFTVAAVYLFAQTLPSHLRWRRFSVRVGPALTGLGLLLAAPAFVAFLKDQPQMARDIVQVSDLLHGAGMQRPEEVLSTELTLEDLGATSRLRFPQAYWVAPGIESLSTLLETARAQGFRFLVYGPAGPRSYPKLADLSLLDTRRAGLTPIWGGIPRPPIAVYRIEPAGPAIERQMAAFGGAIDLRRAEAMGDQSVADTPSWNLGVYLHWGARAPVSRSYKVFVHLVDLAGRVVAQDDGVPAVWTYPTTAWRPGESVIDYHALRIPAAQLGQLLTLTVGLYDEQTGVRLPRTDNAGSVDEAILGTVSIEAGSISFLPADG